MRQRPALPAPRYVKLDPRKVRFFSCSVIVILLAAAGDLAYVLLGRVRGACALLSGIDGDLRPSPKQSLFSCHWIIAQGWVKMKE
jgi:hypothetical protein